MAIYDRQIFVVRAEIVGSDGGFYPLTLDNVTYPQVFDSKAITFNNDIQKCLNYAKAEYHKVCEHMLKRDDRQLQTCVLMYSDGRVIEPYRFTKGALAPIVVPDPESNEPEENPE